MKMASMRNDVKSIAKELPEVNKMHAKYNELYAKYSKKPKDKKDFERGCNLLSKWLKEYYNFPDFTAAPAQAEQMPGQVPQAPPAPPVTKTKEE